MRHQKGESLIEVLIATLVLAIGILGSVALQTKSMTYSKDNLNRSLAIITQDRIANTLRALSVHQSFNSEDFDHLVQLPIMSIEVEPQGITKYHVKVSWRNKEGLKSISQEIFVGTPNPEVRKLLET